MGRKKQGETQAVNGTPEQRKEAAQAALRERYEASAGKQQGMAFEAWIKRDRFIRLAPRRVMQAVKALRNVGRMGQKSGYTYSQDEAGRIEQTIRDAVEQMVDCYAGLVKDNRVNILDS